MSATSLYYPSCESVRGRILGALLRGDSLTQQDALRRFSNFRLAADVEALRKRGWVIDTGMIDVTTRDAGRKSEVGRYTMPTDTIAAAGEFGSQYAESARLVEIARRAT
jgi:hypothetical protein